MNGTILRVPENDPFIGVHQSGTPRAKWQCYYDFFLQKTRIDVYHPIQEGTTKLFDFFKKPSFVNVRSVRLLSRSLA